MARVWTSVVMIAGLALILQIAGVPTLFGNILSLMGITESTNNLSGSTISLLLLGALALTTAVGIIGSLTPSGLQPFLIKAPLVTSVLLLYLSSVVGILNTIDDYSSWIGYPIYILMTMMGIGFLWSAFDWAFGQD